MADLLALAIRCETATEPNRELSCTIARATGYDGGPLGSQTSSPWAWCPDYTASIDAAMTLVPEKWTVANLCQSDRKGWWAELRRGYLTSYDKVAIGQQLENASPALALCAAALRARAASVDTRPQDGDCLQAPLASGAVGASRDAPTSPYPPKRD